MLKGSGILAAALVAVMLLFSGELAFAKSQDGLPNYQNNFRMADRTVTKKKARLAKAKKQRVAALKKKRVTSLKKSKKYRVANAKKHRVAKSRKLAAKRYAQSSRKGQGKSRLARRANPSIVAAVHSHARAAGVPVSVALAVVRQESGFNPNATGSAGEIGLMQLKCSTAKGIGYRGSCRGLYHVSTNLHYGMRYLRMALNRGSVGYYNAGIGAKRLPHGARRYALSVHRKIRRKS
jgi:soluble lytic murein transglycosylase-like protein